MRTGGQSTSHERQNAICASDISRVDTYRLKDVEETEAVDRLGQPDVKREKVATLRL